MSRGIKEGAYMMEITGVDYRSSTYWSGLTLNLKAFNLEVKQKNIKINIFDGGFNVSTESFLEFIGTNVESEMIGKLFYCRLEKNKKGYIEIKKLYMPIDRNKLLYDPRNSKLLLNLTVKKAYKGVI